MPNLMNIMCTCTVHVNIIRMVVFIEPLVCDGDPNMNPPSLLSSHFFLVSSRLLPSLERGEELVSEGRVPSPVATRGGETKSLDSSVML